MIKVCSLASASFPFSPPFELHLSWKMPWFYYIYAGQLQPKPTFAELPQQAQCVRVYLKNSSVVYRSVLTYCPPKQDCSDKQTQSSLDTSEHQEFLCSPSEIHLKSLITQISFTGLYGCSLPLWQCEAGTYQVTVTGKIKSKAVFKSREMCNMSVNMAVWVTDSLTRVDLISSLKSLPANNKYRS